MSYENDDLNGVEQPSDYVKTTACEVRSGVKRRSSNHVPASRIILGRG